MNRNFFISLLMLIPATPMMAQRITAKQSVIDCGQILFRKPITAEFELKNKGFGKTKIDEVRTSCGCTTLSYPTDDIAGGETFMVKAMYDAKQMGHFEKQIGIYANGSKDPLILTLRGTVVDEIVDFSGTYPFTVGDLKTDKNNIEFDDVNKGEVPYQTIHLMNTTNQTIQPVIMHLPNYLTAKVSPTKIAPGHAGTATLVLNSRKLRDYGLTQTSVYVGMFPGDKVASSKEITVSAVLLPGLSYLSEQTKAEAPSLKLSTTTLDLGSFEGKAKKKGEILVKNQGHSTLVIRKLQLFTGGLQVSLNKTKIAAGETAKLKITAIAKDLKMVRRKPRILMITNDPTNAKVVIDIHIKE
ncbi:MAG TPA: DUF1573 domain-containing protein [Prevotella sp.]|nr:DUF1573 domain-containing protein [Prevotella sp.]